MSFFLNLFGGFKFLISFFSLAGNNYSLTEFYFTENFAYHPFECVQLFKLHRTEYLSQCLSAGNPNCFRVFFNSHCKITNHRFCRIGRNIEQKCCNDEPKNVYFKFTRNFIITVISVSFLLLSCPFLRCNKFVGWSFIKLITIRNNVQVFFFFFPYLKYEYVLWELEQFVKFLKSNSEHYPKEKKFSVNVFRFLSFCFVLV